MADEKEHANPFWQEQEALVTDRDRILDGFIGFIEKLLSLWKPSPIVQDGNLNTVKQSAHDRAKYEARVRAGSAQRWGELDCNWEDFQIMRKAYERDSNKFEGYYFRAVPRYVEVPGKRKEYQFLKKAMVYKIKK